MKEDNKDKRRKRRDVRKIDGLTLRTDREIMERGSKTTDNGCCGGKNWDIKGINVAVMMIIIIAAGISVAPRDGFAC